MRLLLTLVCLTPLFAQQPPASGGARPPRQPPKNLKLLDPANLMAVMHRFELALGVECEHCHNKANFASDEKPQKQTARQMILMAREINSKYFPAQAGAEPAAAPSAAPTGATATPANAASPAQMHVTCYTCHHGSVVPMTAAPPGTKPPAAAGAPNPPAEK